MNRMIVQEFKIIKRRLQDGNEEERKIYRLTDKDVEKLNSIGKASGPSLEFCFYLGNKHAKNFFERVYGYRIYTGDISTMIDKAHENTGLKKPKYINVEFYARKTKNF